MSTLLYYGDRQILSGQPVPFLGKQDTFIKYGERWGAKSTFNLKGQITGCTYTDIINTQNRLIQDLSKDFQSFGIVEEGVNIYSKPYCIIRGVNFSQSNYSYVLDYDVNIDCFEQELFSGVFGVLEPTDQWQFEETEDHVINATHTISARGFNTSSGMSNAFENAKNFVLSRTGLNPNINPYFINTASGYNPCLKSIGDRPDRFNGSYSVVENYVADAYYGLDGLLRYTLNFECNQDGNSKVSVQGSVEGCGMVSDVAALRSRYSEFNVYGEALDFYNNVATGGVLNPNYLSSGVTEDMYNRKLTFNVAFDNFTGNNVFFNYSVNIDSGQNGITIVNLEGEIKGRGDLQTRWENVQDYYDTLNPFALAEPIYDDFANGYFPLNPEPTSSGVTFNKFQGEIGVNVSWNNKDLPPVGFRELNYTLNYSPAIQKVTFTPLIRACEPAYYVVDLGFANRVSFSIDGNAKVSCGGSKAAAIANLKQRANSLFGSECPKTRAVLEANELTTGVGDISFKFGWSAESPAKVSNGYTNVDNLSIRV